MVRQARDFLSDLMHELQTKKQCKENHDHCGFNELSRNLHMQTNKLKETLEQAIKQGMIKEFKVDPESQSSRKFWIVQAEPLTKSKYVIKQFQRYISFELEQQKKMANELKGKRIFYNEKKVKKKWKFNETYTVPPSTLANYNAQTMTVRTAKMNKAGVTRLDFLIASINRTLDRFLAIPYAQIFEILPQSEPKYNKEMIELQTATIKAIDKTIQTILNTHQDGKESIFDHLKAGIHGYNDMVNIEKMFKK